MDIKELRDRAKKVPFANAIGTFFYMSDEMGIKIDQGKPRRYQVIALPPNVK